MSTKESPVDQTRLSIAAITACIVQALGEQDPSLPGRVVNLMERTYMKLRDTHEGNIATMETLNWARQFIVELGD